MCRNRRVRFQRCHLIIIRINNNNNYKNNVFVWLLNTVFNSVWLTDSDGMPLGHRNHQSTVNQLRTLAECDARAMESAARAMQEVMVKRIEEASSRVAAAAAAAASSQAKMTTASSAPVKVEDVAASTKRSRSTAGEDQVPSTNSIGSSSSSFVQPQSGPAAPQPPPPAHLLLPGRTAGVGAAHIKLTSRSEFVSIYSTVSHCLPLSPSSTLAPAKGWCLVMLRAAAGKIIADLSTQCPFVTDSVLGLCSILYLDLVTWVWNERPANAGRTIIVAFTFLLLGHSITVLENYR